MTRLFIQLCLQAHLIVQITKGDKSKSVGVVKLNLADFIEAKEKGGLNGVKRKEGLEKCPDKQSKVCFTLSAVPDNTNLNSDQLSCMISEINSDDGGPESEFNFGDFEVKAGAKKKPTQIKAPVKIGQYTGSHDAHELMKKIQAKQKSL